MDQDYATVRCLITEQELAEQLVASFEGGYLPEKFFYWTPLSVKAWLDLCTDGAYRNYIRSLSLIERCASRWFRSHLEPAGEIVLVSLGSGQGDKDLVLLNALREMGRSAHYMAVDTSQSLLEIALNRAIANGFPARGVKADLGADATWGVLESEARGVRRIFCLLGNTIGAFGPESLIRSLSATARAGDLVLVDGEIIRDQTMSGYDNPLNRRFAFAPLAAAGINEQDGTVVFHLSRSEELTGVWRLSKYFEPTRDVTLSIGGVHLAMRAGSRLQMSCSLKFEPAALGNTIRTALFEIEETATSDDGGFEMLLVRRCERTRGAF
ncbi:MAG: L-histidine N(alpha)-methyltransferase [Acidobacteria bacterium]|nr:L-histidine N(alpha)-methyltransferase [Acidobacteriota bacterium]